LPFWGNLILSQGVLYGDTAYQPDTNCPTLRGTTFQIGTDGSSYKVTNVFNTDTKMKNGYFPFGEVALLNGSVYGVAEAGGLGGGTVFQIDASGKASALHRFEDGNFPSPGLILGKDGRFYGTTTLGTKKGVGTVFAVDTSGKQTVLHVFTGKHGDGAYPVAGLVQDAGGDLFGTTQGGGSGNGTVFEITAAGTYIVLHKFKSGASDGQDPFSSPTVGPDGNLYGAASAGGAGNFGVVYEITPNQ
jgi:uncharacterized repeat protein (TIGR03803 family)